MESLQPAMQAPKLAVVVATEECFFWGGIFLCFFCLFVPLSWFLLGKTVFSYGFSVISLGFAWFFLGKTLFLYGFRVISLGFFGVFRRENTIFLRLPCHFLNFFGFS